MEKDGRAVLFLDFGEVIDGNGSCLRNDEDRFLYLLTGQNWKQDFFAEAAVFSAADIPSGSIVLRFGTKRAPTRGAPYRLFFVNLHKNLRLTRIIHKHPGGERW